MNFGYFKPKTALWNGALLELNFQFILVCILPQPAFYSQSAVCIYTQSAFYPWSAVCTPQSAFYTDWLEIQFRMASFSKMSLLTCPCLRRKKVEKSQAILEHLMTFRSSISTGKPEQLLSMMCFFSVFWSRAYDLCGLSLYTSNDLNYNSIRFKKPLDIFWPQIQRKGSKDYLVMILAINRKLWAIFLPRVHLWKQ